ncbi:protein-S-isoprenylcysteine O-methyltransferase [Prosthecobacter sp.]|uniref:protein-S-isoprenylcysteine O-methyltransferase n=1 Tax=Prosthecobacter sp. TaxID=1965333 RepID=UPI001D8D96A5|nr:protein-S-isoprenylcysteine O-methyltransferase [Prosthecobacter sp.]MCB1276202.1 isoprenylcysteine carboxylmethyltransferase family protein [Prosthecobacter sp.]
MNILQPWNIVFLIGFVIYYRIRHVFILRTKDEKKEVRRMDGLEKGLLAGMAPGTLLLPVLYLFTPWLAFADYRLPIVVPWIGTVAMIVSLWLFWRSHSDLGQNWSVSLELRENHELVTRGVYRFIRHPMYASIWLWAFAQGMLLQNWLAGWSVAPAFAAMYFMRVPREEQLMCEKFGDQYRTYMRQTGRLWPRWTAGEKA